MKKRTRVFAWISAIGASVWIIRSAWTLVTLLIERPKPQLYWQILGWESVEFAVSLLLMLGWTSLLDRRVWAWRLLVAISGALGVAFGIGMVVASFLVEDRVATSIAVLALPSVVPLWVLLTDRPSGWTQPANPQSDIPNPQ